MPRCCAAHIDVSNKHRHRLETIVRQHQAPQALVTSARIILMASVTVRLTLRNSWGS